MSKKSRNWDEYFLYDAEAGHLLWKSRPLSHFASEWAWKAWNAQFPGKKAGRENGYGIVGLWNKKIRVHRIIWEMHHGPIPEGMVIDHMDRDIHNNRLSNLRLATKSQNAMNSGLYKRNTSGARGVNRQSPGGKWEASININGKRTRLGLYSTVEEAKKVRDRVAETHYKEFLP